MVPPRATSSSSGDPTVVSRERWGDICQVGTALRMSTHRHEPTGDAGAASFIAQRWGGGGRTHGTGGGGGGTSGQMTGSAAGPQEGEGASAAVEVRLQLLQPGLHRHQAPGTALAQGDAVGHADLQGATLPTAGGREVRRRQAGGWAAPVAGDPSPSPRSPLAVRGQHAHQLPDAVVQWRLGAVQTHHQVVVAPHVEHHQLVPPTGHAQPGHLGGGRDGSASGGAASPAPHPAPVAAGPRPPPAFECSRGAGLWV